MGSYLFLQRQLGRETEKTCSASHGVQSKDNASSLRAFSMRDTEVKLLLPPTKCKSGTQGELV